jgi:hypothetical protein
MLKSWPGFIAALAVVFATLSMNVLSAEEPLSVPNGVGQLETAPGLVWGGVDDDGREYYVNGQPANSGKLILTASNGFFTPGVCRASGESLLPKTGDDGLIAPNYAILLNWKKTDGTIRWHLWLAGRGRFDSTCI